MNYFLLLLTIPIFQSEPLASITWIANNVFKNDVQNMFLYLPHTHKLGSITEQTESVRSDVIKRNNDVISRSGMIWPSFRDCFRREAAGETALAKNWTEDVAKRLKFYKCCSVSLNLFLYSNFIYPKVGQLSSQDVSAIGKTTNITKSHHNPSQWGYFGTEHCWSTLWYAANYHRAKTTNGFEKSQFG